MANDKSFLTYNQQMKKHRKDKKIDCNGTPHKISLVRSGYFNMINGYKTPFTCGTDANGNHTYFPNTTLSQINSLKKFDESLRIFLLKYITQVEEEVRTLTGYKFDQCNDNGLVEGVLGIVFQHGFSTSAVYPFNPAISEQDDNNPYDKVYHHVVRGKQARENPRRQAHQGQNE